MFQGEAPRPLVKRECCFIWYLNLGHRIKSDDVSKRMISRTWTWTVNVLIGRLAQQERRRHHAVYEALGLSNADL